MSASSYSNSDAGRKGVPIEKFERYDAAFRRAVGLMCFAFSFWLPLTVAEAQVLAAPGYIYSAQATGSFPEGCVALAADGGVFTALGVQFSGGTGETRSIVHIGIDGTQRVVATGFNAVADCHYDPASDVLYVADSGAEFTGAVTGDTVFALPSASTAVSLTAAGNELLPSGSFAFAAGVTADAEGDLYVSDAAGPGAGSVTKVDLALAMPVSFLPAGLDYAGGVEVDADGSVLVADSDGATFANRVRRYSAAGALLGIVSADNYDHGSVNLALDGAGRAILTGSNTIARLEAGGGVLPLVTGMASGFGPAFGGGLDIDRFTGRVLFNASNFDGGPDDRALHQLIEVERLAPGRGREDRECLLEFFGVELVAPAPDRPARRADCFDGQACDADGVADGVCTFPLGACLAVSDPRLPACSIEEVTSFDLRRARPESSELEAMADRVTAELPASSAFCSLSQGYPVPLRLSASGIEKAGKAKVVARVEGRLSGQRRVDSDRLKLRCLPAL